MPLSMASPRFTLPSRADVPPLPHVRESEASLPLAALENAEGDDATTPPVCATRGYSRVGVAPRAGAGHLSCRRG